MDSGLGQVVQQGIRRRPPAVPLRESVRNEMINDTPMEHLENLSRRVKHLAVKWPYVQRVVDAINDNYGRGRGGRGRAGGDGNKHREIVRRSGGTMSVWACPRSTRTTRPLSVASGRLLQQKVLPLLPTWAPRAAVLDNIPGTTPDEIAGPAERQVW